MQLAGQCCRRLVASGSRIHATRRALASTGCQPVTQMCAVRCPEVSWAGGRGMSVLPAIIEHMNETNALNVTGDGPAGSPASPVPTTGSQGGAGPDGPQDPDAPLERLERLEERICELAAHLADLLTRARPDVMQITVQTACQPCQRLIASGDAAWPGRAAHPGSSAASPWLAILSCLSTELTLQVGGICADLVRDKGPGAERRGRADIKHVPLAGHPVAHYTHVGDIQPHERCRLNP